jgi:threonine aldolase
MMAETALDLRSDAVTRPTPEMWAAMRDAPLGWAAAGEDRSVTELEYEAAAITGKESGLLLPTGTMANLVALMTHAAPGDQFILEAASHILWSEERSYAAICGLSPKVIAGDRGRMDPEMVRGAITDAHFGHRPRTGLICLENTHNASGGSVLTTDDMRRVAIVANEFDIPIHLDGARIFNASVATGVAVSQLADAALTVAISLSKGLSAPAGALLCGPRRLIDRARLNARRLGACSVPQLGIVAAAGLCALRTMIPRLAQDHLVAQALGNGLAAVRGLRVDTTTIRTNIVLAKLDGSANTAEALVVELRRQGVLALAASDDTVRFVTHRHITEDDVATVVATVESAVAKTAQAQ